MRVIASRDDVHPRTIPPLDLEIADDTSPEEVLRRAADLSRIAPRCKKPIPKSSVRLQPSRAATAELAKPLGDIALEPDAHKIPGLRRRRDAACAPQCGLETQ